jgi:non-ribosomal peptide synthetase component F
MYPRTVEEQVEQTPDAIALEYEDKQLTYRELNRKANQLAHNLISLGIGPENSLEFVLNHLLRW